MDVIINKKETKYLGQSDLKLHNFYLAETKNKTHRLGVNKNVIIFILKGIGDEDISTRVYYFYENEEFITYSNISYLLDNFRIKENVTEKCKLICEL